MTPTPTENNELVPAGPGQAMSLSAGASIAEVVRQRALIKELMSQVLVEGEHYGSIPGTGSEKKVLLKPGAEKINTMFKLAPKVAKEEIIDLGEGHREYRLTVSLTHYPTGMFVGEGVGSCSTMESKYRYRNTADFDVLEQRIPADYKEKKDHYRRQGFGAKKVEGVWQWVKFGDEHKSENPDIADTWNTCYKMAEKRAKVNATLTATGASDFFTQDLEENHARTPQKASGGEDWARGGEHDSKPATRPTGPRKATSEVWQEKLIDVEEDDASGRMVYTARFESGRGAGTIRQELANKAYTAMKNDPEKTFTATVKPGRTPNTFELVDIE